MTLNCELLIPKFNAFISVPWCSFLKIDYYFSRHYVNKRRKCYIQHTLFHHDLNFYLLTPNSEAFISVPQCMANVSFVKIFQIVRKVLC